MRENTDTAIGLVFGHEGGYVNAKTDAGGPTKYGITAKTLGASRKLGRAATAAEVQKLTLREAEEILRAQYLAPIKFDDLPSGLDYAVFDFAVNSGPAQAAKTLQRLVGAGADGIIGNKTIAAIRERCLSDAGLEKLIVDYIDARMDYLRGLKGSKGFSANGRGWTIRVTGKDPKGQWKAQPGVIGHALTMAKKPAEERKRLLSLAQTIVEVPTEEIFIQARASAAPSMTGLSSTKQGVAIITALLGLLVTIISALATALEPFANISPTTQKVFVFLTAAGPIVSGAAVAWNALLEKWRILSGAPI
ncbi:glycoside hydrolase family 108 protein [Microvirga sp. Mcv34]|uniref:glycoside hydrolase family 108 protein n=1 Tax=Microvirga sp. Mcv34 TaxID=2926016 RepID=UPI0021C76573|nr:glycosyl hydrolase 108 family protein [Microvirga sp. Mcv34]